MTSIWMNLRSAFAATLVLATVTGGVYPLVVFGLGQALFPHRANGSLIVDRHGATRGSALLGQNFTGPRYFHPRPSAAGQGYDAANSSGSNLGPTSRKLRSVIEERIAAYRAQESLPDTSPVPADAVTASGSGLDPHISVRNAELQMPRVAKARNLDPDEVRVLIHAHTDGPDLGLLGEPGVNVLELNLALDERP